MITIKRHEKFQLIIKFAGANKVAIGTLAGAILLTALVFFADFAEIETLVYLTAYLLASYPVLVQAGKNIFRGKIFDENFLMTIATLGAILIGEYPEAIAVMVFYRIGEFFEDYAIERSKSSLSQLLQLQPERAWLKRDSNWIEVVPAEVRKGSRLLIKPGEKIPLDGIVVAGNSFLNTAALTGEAKLQPIKRGSQVLSGSLNQENAFEIETTQDYADSTLTKILKLVTEASNKKTTTEKFITRFASKYTPLVVLGAIIIALVPLLFGAADSQEWFRRALVFLVIACPCALVLSVPLSYFSALGAAAKQQILVRGSDSLDKLSRIQTVAFDKTGTLTQGKFQIVKIETTAEFASEQILRFAATLESQSNHPLARSITLASQAAKQELLTASDLRETAGKGISGTIAGHVVRAGKRSWLTCDLPAGLVNTGMTETYVQIGDQYAGRILLADSLKPTTESLIKFLRQRRVKHLILLTGDNLKNAQQTVASLNLDDVKAGLLPADKLKIMENYRQIAHRQKHQVMFVGDGVNDAPVLASADVSVAMGQGGAAAAIELADIVLLKDQPQQLQQVFELADKTKKIVWENIGLALIIKFALLLLGAFGLATLWEAVFADVGVTLLAVFNALRLQWQRSA